MRGAMCLPTHWNKPMPSKHKDRAADISSYPGSDTSSVLFVWVQCSINRYAYLFIGACLICHDPVWSIQILEAPVFDPRLPADNTTLRIFCFPCVSLSSLISKSCLGGKWKEAIYKSSGLKLFYSLSVAFLHRQCRFICAWIDLVPAPSWKVMALSLWWPWLY